MENLEKNIKKIYSLQTLKKHTRKLKRNRVKCMKYSNDIYKKCDFFYEKNDKLVDDKKCDYIAEHKKDSNGRLYTSLC